MFSLSCGVVELIRELVVQAVRSLKRGRDRWYSPRPRLCCRNPIFGALPLVHFTATTPGCQAGSRRLGLVASDVSCQFVYLVLYNVVR